MAGGVGSRFWPASRETKPKQFLDILGVGKSLLQLTYDRCLKIAPKDRIFVMTNQNYADQVAEHLPDLERDQIFLEPSRNNTAPCIALASLKLRKRFDDGVCLLAPSDAVILDEQSFVDQARRAMEFAAGNDALVTLGIQPSRPDTGYGYIQFEQTEAEAGVHEVLRFTEKPDLETAKAFVDSGEYLWNSGMFVWSLDSILSAFDQYAKSITDILAAGLDSFFTDGEAQFLQEHYPRTEKTSIDYAIMENANNVYVLPSSFGWSDLGTWGSLYQYIEKDNDQSVAITANVLNRNSGNNLVYSSKDKLFVLSDLNDYVIVDDEDVLLIFPRDKEQVVKEIRNSVENQGYEDYL